MIKKLKKYFSSVKTRLNPLFELKSVLNEERKKEFVLNTTTTSLIFLILLLFILILIKASFIPSYLLVHDYLIYVNLFILLIFLIVTLLLSRKKKIKTASFLLISFVFLIIIEVSLIWGTELPPTLSFFIFLIMLSGLLTNFLLSFIVALVSELSIIALSILQAKKIIEPEIVWKSVYGNCHSVITLSLMLFLILIFLYWSKKEMKQTLIMTQESEKKLIQERKLLDINIKKKDSQLEQSQIRELSNLKQLAEFGRYSAGLFHELANPLTALNLIMEQMSKECKKNEAWDKFGHNIERANKAAKKMGNFLKGVKKQLSHQEEKNLFSLNKEIEEVLEMIEFKSLRSQVNLVFKADKEFFLNNNSLQFYHLASNLISNAIDSYDNKENKTDIIISLVENDKEIILSIKDGGCGLSLNEKESMFLPFFSTKKYSHGTGLGLIMVKSIVENDFKGTISVESKKNVGTNFIIRLPRII